MIRENSASKLLACALGACLFVLSARAPELITAIASLP